MTTVALCPTAGCFFQAFTTGGLPLNIGKIYTYIAGGTTPQATYTTSAGNVANANPIILDTDGRTPNEVWLVQGVAYRFDLKDALGNLIKTYDNVSGINDVAAFAASSGASLIGYISNATGAVATTVQAKLRQTVSVQDFGAVGDGSHDDTAAINLAIVYASAAGSVNIAFPGGNYLISGALTAITGSDIAFTGQGGIGVAELLQSNASVGNFFTIGANTPAAAIGRISIGTLRFRNTATLTNTDAALIVKNTSNVTFRDIDMSSVAAIATLGSATDAASVTTFNNVHASCNGSLGVDFLQLINATSTSFNRVRINSADMTSSTSFPLAAYVGIVPVSGGLVDTVFLSDVTAQESAKERPFGIKIDHTAANVVNIWVSNGAYDHTKYAAYRIMATAGAFDLRNITFTGVRTFPDSGRVGYITNAGTGKQDPVQWNGCLGQYVNGAGDTTYDAGDTQLVGMKVTGNAVLQWVGGSFRQNSAANNVTAAFYMGVGNFSIQGVSLGGRNHGTCNTDYAVQTAADVDNFVVSGTTGGDDMNTGFFNNYAYAAGSSNRIINSNVTKASELAFVTVTGATFTITEATVYVVANFAGTVTLTLGSAKNIARQPIIVKTILNQTVVSASSNVIPLVGGAAGTAICAGTAGTSAILVPNGTNWEIMNA